MFMCVCYAGKEKQKTKKFVRLKGSCVAGFQTVHLEMEKSEKFNCMYEYFFGWGWRGDDSKAKSPSVQSQDQIHINSSQIAAGMVSPQCAVG